MSTLEKAFTSKKPEHFKIFGSSVYVHVTKDAKKKLEPTIEIGIFVGYTDTLQGKNPLADVFEEPLIKIPQTSICSEGY